MNRENRLPKNCLQKLSRLKDRAKDKDRGKIKRKLRKMAPHKLMKEIKKFLNRTMLNKFLQSHLKTSKTVKIVEKSDCSYSLLIKII